MYDQVQYLACPFPFSCAKILGRSRCLTRLYSIKVLLVMQRTPSLWSDCANFVFKRTSSMKKKEKSMHFFFLAIFGRTFETYVI